MTKVKKTFNSTASVVVERDSALRPGGSYSNPYVNPYAMPDAVRQAVNALPEKAERAAASGDGSVTVLYSAASVSPYNYSVVPSREMQILAAGIVAKGFKAELKFLEPSSESGPVGRFDLVASWDANHRPDLAKVADNAGEQKMADSAAALRKDLPSCFQLFAADAAAALDENRLPDASKLLADCGVESTGLAVDLTKFQIFVESVSAYDEKGKGLDINLKYGVGRLTAFYLDGIEIK